MSKHQDLTNPNSLRSKIRRKRLKHLKGLITEIISRENISTINICDIGGTYRYWLIFPFDEFQNINFIITLINLEKIVSSEESKFRQLLNYSNVKLNSEIGNGCDMSHKSDNFYHLSHSNSVIEHVGNWREIKKFASETKRVGKYHFIQTPNYWFPIEPHYFLPFVHYFPRPIHTKLLMLFKKKNFDEATSKFEDNRMLSKSEFRFAYPDSTFITERFYGLGKSYIATI